MKIQGLPTFKSKGIQNKVRYADTKNQINALRLSKETKESGRLHNKRWESGG